MAWYLGSPGALTKLPDPQRATQMPMQRSGGTHVLLSGGRVRDGVTIKRSWQLSWKYLTRDQVGVLDGFVYGTVGPGPYVLVDPEQRNLLKPNVSAGTDVTADTTDWVPYGAVTAVSSTSVAWLGTRSLLGTIPNGTAISSNLVGSADFYPALPNVPYTLSVYVYTNPASNIAVRPVLGFYDSTKTIISTFNGPSVPTINAFQQSAITGTAPANTAYVYPVLKNPTVPSGTSIFYTDAWQLEQAASASAWVPGLGVPYVTVEPGDRIRQLQNANDYTLTLVEV